MRGSSAPTRLALSGFCHHRQDRATVLFFQAGLEGVRAGLRLAAVAKEIFALSFVPPTLAAMAAARPTGNIAR
jgi:hypothetical protein